MSYIKKFVMSICVLVLAFVLTTSCSSDDVNERPHGDFQVQVTTYAEIEAAESSNGSSNRASIVKDNSTYKAKYATGDVLLVWGKADSKYFYGELALQPGFGPTSGSFTGTITVESEGPSDPLASATTINAILAPQGWSSKGYTKDDTNHCYWHKTFKPVTTITDIGPYVHIVKNTYESSTKKFTLTSKCSIIHIKWTGMAASQSYAVHAYDQAGGTEYSDGTSISANGSGVLEFFIPDTLAHSYHFVFNGDREYAYNHSYFATEDHKIYNVARTVTTLNLNNISQQTTIADKTIAICSGTTSYGLIIPNGGAVILDGASISSSGYAPITCSGNATIVTSTANKNSHNLTSLYTSDYPGIQPGGANTTLTIQGSGTLYVHGGLSAAGIGSAKNGTCGNIIINGGTIWAEGGACAAGIGTGWESTCGDITITSGTKLLTAQKGNSTGNPPKNYIGVGYSGTCGDIYIDGVKNPTVAIGTIGCFTSSFNNNYSWVLTKNN